jgi:hypothetical protein
MRRVFVLLSVTAALWAQDATKLRYRVSNYSCAGKQDGVIYRSGDLMVACIGGEQVSNTERRIPQSLVDEFNRKMDHLHKSIEKLEVKGEQMKVRLEKWSEENRDRLPRGASPAMLARRKQTAPTAPATAQALTPAPTSPVAPVVTITAEQLDRLKAGMTREEVLAVLGQPASKLFVPDEKRESLTYRLAGGQSAKVQLLDGKVAVISGAETR